MTGSNEQRSELDRLNEELAARTGQAPPQYSLVATTPSGKMLGAVSLAPGLFENVDEACAEVQRFFKSLKWLAGQAVNVRAITADEGNRAAAKLRDELKPVDLSKVLIDVKNATDCCVITIAEHCKKRVVLIANVEVACKTCGSTFRYVHDGEQNYAWLWMLPKKYVAPAREIFPLEEAYIAAQERASARLKEDLLSQSVSSASPQYNAGHDPFTGEAYKSPTFKDPGVVPSEGFGVRIYQGSQHGDSPVRDLRKTIRSTDIPLG